MNKLNILWVLFALVFTACDNDLEQLYDKAKENPIAPVLTIEGSSDIVMKEDMPDIYYTTLNWTRANYGKGISVAYALEISDNEGFEGETMKIDLGKDLYIKALDVVNFIAWANHFNAYNEETGEIDPITLYLRIEAASIDGKGIPTDKTAVSNAESINLSQYEEGEEPWDPVELTIKFNVVSGDWGEYAVYSWGNDEEVYGAWPGLVLTADDDGWYSFTVPVSRPINLIINNNGNGKQFDFLKDPRVDVCYEFSIGEENNDCDWVEVDCPTAYPTTMYMIGDEFGSWDWSSNGIVEMTPVWGLEGHFWAVRYISSGKGFKWCAERAWSGDFFSLGEDLGYTVNDGNAFVAADGMYMIYMDMTSGKISIEEAQVYGMGDCFGGWDMGSHAFSPEEKTMTYTTSGSGELRIYATSEIAPIGGDWWKMEFVPIDGKIEYRGNGGDQTRLNVEAGKKVILDFNAGTASFE